MAQEAEVPAQEYTFTMDKESIARLRWVTLARPSYQGWRAAWNTLAGFTLLPNGAVACTDVHRIHAAKIPVHPLPDQPIQFGDETLARLLSSGPTPVAVAPSAEYAPSIDSVYSNAIHAACYTFTCASAKGVLAALRGLHIKHPVGGNNFCLVIEPAADGEILVTRDARTVKKSHMRGGKEPPVQYPSATVKILGRTGEYGTPRFGVNLRYLCDALSRFARLAPKGSLTIKVSGSIADPIVIGTLEGEGDHVALIMPMKIG